MSSKFDCAITEHFYNAYLDGFGDHEEIDGILYTAFDVTEDDENWFPELRGYRTVVIWEDEMGFVYSYLQ